MSSTSTLEQTLSEWKSKPRRMGCVEAANWFCKRVPSFKPIRLNRYTHTGELFQHVVCSDGVIYIDLAPHNDCPTNGKHDDFIV